MSQQEMSSVLANYIQTDDLPAQAKRPKKPRSIKKILKRTLLTVIVLVMSLGGFLAWHVYADAAKITGDKNPLQLLSLFKGSKLNETNGRVNILLAGYSVDDPGHQGAELTDSIMVVSINPSTKNAVLISIPRDTYVDIPGFGYQKINAAYEDGQSENFSRVGYASGGMGLLEEVVQDDFGITSDYYGLLDYTAFKDAVNAVGGISIDIDSPDPRGLYDPNTNLKLPNGEVTLTGQEALDLSRARGDGYGSYGFPNADFDRTMYQQKMLISLKEKASTTSVIANPFKIAKLADAIGSNFKTDMLLGDMETVYNDTKGISASNIMTVTLNDVNGQDLFSDYTTPDGADALVPAAGFDDFSQIQSTISNSLSSN